MEPIPETTEAVNELDPMVTDDDLLDQLRVSAGRVREVAAQCVGISVTMREHEVTLTLVATDAEIALLDAVHYVSGGPCVEAVVVDTVVGVDHQAMDEKGWRLFAEATAARGVASTLSIPVMEGERVVGGINLYGATTDAFDGHHGELAEIFGAWASGAVTNADLSFSTLDEARRAPQHLRDHTQIDVATGLLAGLLDIEIDQARRRLDDSACRAGVGPAEIAALLVELLGRRPD